MILSALSLPSFAGGIAGVASGLLLCFRGDFPRDPLSEFRIAGLLLGFQGGLTSGEFAGKARMRIPASIPAGLAAAVVKALSVR
jgi:hypothetical protein